MRSDNSPLSNLSAISDQNFARWIYLLPTKIFADFIFYRLSSLVVFWNKSIVYKESVTSIRRFQWLNQKKNNFCLSNRLFFCRLTLLPTLFLQIRGTHNYSVLATIMEWFHNLHIILLIKILTSKFSGLMSRCTMLSSWRYLTADARSRIMYAEHGSEKRVLATIASNKSPPCRETNNKKMMIM